MKKQTKHTKGFTLVELIVVLVILAILIALLVPALTGYIDKANEKAAIAECRQVVVATQGKASELYGKDEFSHSKMDSLTDEILKLAEVDGTIDSWDFDSSTAALKTLTYTTKKNITVLYEDKKYTVLKARSLMGSAKGLTILSNLLHNQKDMTVDSTKPSLNNKSRVLQNYLMEENGGKLPGLNASEKALYEKLGIKNVDTDQVAWKPVYSANGEIFLVADSKKSSDLGAAYGYVIYYNNKYYAHKSADGKKYSDIWISDQGAVIDVDSNDSEWEEVTLDS